MWISTQLGKLSQTILTFQPIRVESSNTGLRSVRNVQNYETNCRGYSVPAKYVDIPSNARREACRHFKDKMREYLHDRINELATNSENRNMYERLWYSGQSSWLQIQKSGFD
jgi:hypothetical protein